ncbi:hypothetical protein BJ170DRAFT_355384 [Xylariales sp. AK1849]|nr:hypothetical protein BJ170DRAFT_355384 [Xylariales sp. AK1849]
MSPEPSLIDTDLTEPMAHSTISPFDIPPMPAPMPMPPPPPPPAMAYHVPMAMPHPPPEPDYRRGFLPHLAGNGLHPPMQLPPGPMSGTHGSPPDYRPLYIPPPNPRPRPVTRVHYARERDDNAESVTEADTESVLSDDDYPDVFYNWRTFTVDDKVVKTVYEAWEVINMYDTEIRSTWKRLLGINLGETWESMADGYVRLSPLPAFEQGELAVEVEDAASEYEAKYVKDGKKSYTQDLANRAFRLPADVYNQLQRLLDRKIHETNKNPHRQRDWNIVLLRKEELPLTEMAPERKKKGVFRRSKEPAWVGRWFIVIKGEETKASKEGWMRHDRYTNPWRKVDRHDMMDTRHENERRRR